MAYGPDDLAQFDWNSLAEGDVGQQNGNANGVDWMSGENAPSTRPYTAPGYRKPVPRWAQILAGAAAGFQDPGFAARTAVNQDAQDRERQFEMQKQMSSQRFTHGEGVMDRASRLANINAEGGQARQTGGYLAGVTTQEELKRKQQEDERQDEERMKDLQALGPEAYKAIFPPTTAITRTGPSPIGGLTIPTGAVTTAVPLGSAAAQMKLSPMVSAFTKAVAAGPQSAAELEKTKAEAEALRAHGRFFNSAAGLDAGKAAELGGEPLSDEVLTESLVKAGYNAKQIPQIVAGLSGNYKAQKNFGIFAQKTRAAGNFMPVNMPAGGTLNVSPDFFNKK